MNILTSSYHLGIVKAKTQNHCFLRIKEEKVLVWTLGHLRLQVCYLDVDKKLPEVAWRHHDGGVELDNVALIQGNVMVSSQSLENKAVCWRLPEKTKVLCKSSNASHLLAVPCGKILPISMISVDLSTNLVQTDTKYWLDCFQRINTTDFGNSLSLSVANIRSKWCPIGPMLWSVIKYVRSK